MNYPNLSMQWRQELHDKLFHGDIYNLSIIGRLRHLTLHLSKYQGKYLEEQMSGTEWTRRGIVVDALIVLQSMANTLSYEITGQSDYSKDVGFSYNALVIRTGHLCKYLEAWDHLESIDYRDNISRAIEDLIYCWNYLQCNDPVVEGELIDRLVRIEKKSTFYEQLVKKHPELMPHPFRQY